MVRAKFRCEGKIPRNEGFEIVMRPVVSGSKENESFYHYTPGGQLSLATINAKAAAQLEVGREYYLDIIPADNAPLPEW